MIKRYILNPRIWGYGLFWSWNLIFLAFMGLGFAPLFIPLMIPATLAGIIPPFYIISGLVLTLIPFVAVVLGATRLRREPLRLLALGYGVEGPLMIALIIRLFLLRDATPLVNLLLGAGTIGLAVFLWELIDDQIADRHPALSYFRLFGATLLLGLGLYIAVWGMFYAIPLLASLGDIVTSSLIGLGEMLTQGSRALIFAPLGIILFLYTLTLLVGLPIAVPLLYTRTWKHSMDTLHNRRQGRIAAALSGATLIVAALIFVFLNIQPQKQAFAMLAAPPLSRNEAQARLQQESLLREGLVNAYLSSYRYLGTIGEMEHVQDLYQQTLKMSPEQSAGVERFYDIVARPLLYDPISSPVYDQRERTTIAMKEDPARAAELYQQFFDRPITKGERSTIANAVRHNIDPNQALQAWQAVDDREVHLTQQELTVTEHGDWASMELFEVYQNISAQRQEVVYYFSLPESAVLTGLWLGNSPDRAARFNFHVAPRGAAQQVYRNQVRYQIDPALLEQVGPRQYRLRVFPIEPQTVSRGNSQDNIGTIKVGPKLYLWMTWQVLGNSDNSWPLPHLSDLRNVYWDFQTQRTLNGKSWSIGNVWLPASIPATTPIQPTAHRVDFPDGRSVILRPAAAENQAALPRNTRLAVVIDRSHSMQPQADAVQAALKELSAQVDPAGVDLYLTASDYRGEGPSRTTLDKLDPGELFYYGGQNATQLLEQYASLQKGENYAAVLVLTDDAGYEATGKAPAALTTTLSAAPLWMIHLNSTFPSVYDDATMEALQASGGGAVTSLDEALNRLADQLAGHDDRLDGYTWTTVSQTEAAGQEATLHAAGDPFAAFAARRLILAEMHRQRGKLTDIDILDNLHDIAIRHTIVTPYSSMLVLINAEQERQLKDLSNDEDRFTREQEAVGETQPIVVPEPKELLLALGLLGLLAGFVLFRRSK